MKKTKKLQQCFGPSVPSQRPFHRVQNIGSVSESARVSETCRHHGNVCVTGVVCFHKQISHDPVDASDI